MSYQVVRAADDDPDVMRAVLAAIAARGSEPGYYVELEGEPGEVLAAGYLIGFDAERDVVVIDKPHPGEHGEPGEPSGAHVVVAVDRVTLVEVP